MYSKYSEVSKEMLEIREIVLSRKQPRRMYVQANTEYNPGWLFFKKLRMKYLFISLPLTFTIFNKKYFNFLIKFFYSYLFLLLLGEDVKLIEFPATAAGLIESFNKRYPNHDSELEDLWIADKQFHSYMQK